MKCNTCEEYADIHKVKCKPTGELLYICYECDSLWREDQLNQNSTLRVEDYIKQHSLSGKWKEIFEKVDDQMN